MLPCPALASIHLVWHLPAHLPAVVFAIVGKDAKEFCANAALGAGPEWGWRLVWVDAQPRFPGRFSLVGKPGSALVRRIVWEASGDYPGFRPGAGDDEPTQRYAGAVSVDFSIATPFDAASQNAQFRVEHAALLQEFQASGSGEKRGDLLRSRGARLERLQTRHGHQGGKKIGHRACWRAHCGSAATAEKQRQDACT